MYPELPSGPGSVCAILDDVVTMVDLKTESLRTIRNFLKSHSVSGACIRGKPRRAVAKLVFADFPTSLGVAFVQEKSTPVWNVFSEPLSVACAVVADLYVADEGWFVTLSITEHFPSIFIAATEKGFALKQCLNVVVENGYIGPAPFKKVCSLKPFVY